MSLLNHLGRFLERHQASARSRRVVVGFSGGPDSTALLWGLKQLGPELGFEPHAVHVDHAIDKDSRRRSALATELCRKLDVEVDVVRLSVESISGSGANLEAAARAARYQAFESRRRFVGASHTLTAHHADDQIETVLIRMLYGSGVEGLAGIRPVQGCVLRPLLEMRRDEVHLALQGSNLEPVEDPSNLHLASLRNRIRHILLPQLAARNPGLDRRLLSLSSAAARIRSAVETRLRRELDLRKSPSGSSLDRIAFEKLPKALWPYALALMSREAHVGYPPPAGARQELRRQIASSPRIGVDCGSSWRWQSRGDRLNLSKAPLSTAGFAYTVETPGECLIPELALRFRIRRGAVDSWMFRSSSRRAGLDLLIGPGDRVIVRNRRQGDRVQPFGCPYTRRLKDVLIDRRVPRHERGRLPLLEVNSRLVWVPGVTIDDGARVKAGGVAWIAELESI